MFSNSRSNIISKNMGSNLWIVCFCGFERVQKTFLAFSMNLFFFKTFWACFKRFSALSRYFKGFQYVFSAFSKVLRFLKSFFFIWKKFSVLCIFCKRFSFLVASKSIQHSQQASSVLIFLTISISLDLFRNVLRAFTKFSGCFKNLRALLTF